MLSHKYDSAHESVVGSLYLRYDQQRLVKRKFYLSLSWQPLVGFYCCHGGGDEQTLLIVSNSRKMATETYILLKIVYGNGLSHMCACL